MTFELLLIQSSFGSFFNALGFELPVPRKESLHTKQEKYKFSTEGGYPPHLDVIPKNDQTPQWEIFDTLGLVQSATLLPKIVPKTGFLGTISTTLQEKALSAAQFLAGVGPAPRGSTIATIEENNKTGRKTGTDIMRGQNIGDYEDWYSDARFAQQQFTGTNSVTITEASQHWTGVFRAFADAQGLRKMVNVIGSGSLYVQDCSFFRTAFKVSEEAELAARDENGAGELRYGCATVTLFKLFDSGLLHPLAIIINYKKKTEDSVVIFNRRLSPNDKTHNEKTDWPWRYAKTCAQVSDWLRHEIEVHLVHTHLVEEAIIVATHRQIPESHPVFFLLEPHWFRTLSLNAAARATLVPSIIFDLVGLTGEQALNYVNHAYATFNFEKRYVPNDLKTRGFERNTLDQGKFRNYTYARNMVEMWDVIHTWVDTVISLWYKTDQSVIEDTYIRDWCQEIRSMHGAGLSTFPEITTKDGLVDAITMCIHIASPQNTAVNYLQNFYHAFVINKPAALYTPLPKSLAELNKYTEHHLVAALPIGRTREWLLSAHIPWLLSFKVAEENNIVNFAASVYNVYRKRTQVANDVAICKAAEKLYEDLRNLTKKFDEHYGEMEQGDNGIKGGTEKIPYHVMSPWSTAMSILI